MKITREDLKALMKEILVEILNEGLGGGTAVLQPSMTKQVENRNRNSLTSTGPSRLAQKPLFDPRLDKPYKAVKQSDALKEAIVRESGGNPVMADILADTARTTLPAQLASGYDSLSNDLSPQIVQEEKFHGDPEDVFGPAAALRPDGSSHWADLAFMASGKKSA